MFPDFLERVVSKFFKWASCICIEQSYGFIFIATQASWEVPLDQLKEAGKAQKWPTIEEFEAYWRKEELQDPEVLPPSEGPQYNDRFIDAKWKQRAAKGEGKKRRRASKEDYKGKVRGVKQNKRFTSAMDIK